MPRPKGSKNKPKVETLVSVEQYDEQITAVEKEIAELTEKLKARKTELKELTKAREAAEAAAAEAKAAENQAKLLEAVNASGKSVEEIIAMIQG